MAYLLRYSLLFRDLETSRVNHFYFLGVIVLEEEFPEVDLKISKKTVTARTRKLGRYDYVFPWFKRIENFIRKIIKKPVKFIPLKFTIEEQECIVNCLDEENIKDLEQIIIEDINKEQ